MFEQQFFLKGRRESDRQRIGIRGNLFRQGTAGFLLQEHERGLRRRKQPCFLLGADAEFPDGLQIAHDHAQRPVRQFAFAAQPLNGIGIECIGKKLEPAVKRLDRQYFAVKQRLAGLTERVGIRDQIAVHIEQKKLGSAARTGKQFGILMPGFAMIFFRLAVLTHGKCGQGGVSAGERTAHRQRVAGSAAGTAEKRITETARGRIERFLHAIIAGHQIRPDLRGVFGRIQDTEVRQTFLIGNGRFPLEDTDVPELERGGNRGRDRTDEGTELFVIAFQTEQDAFTGIGGPAGETEIRSEFPEECPHSPDMDPRTFQFQCHTAFHTGRPI